MKKRLLSVAMLTAMFGALFVPAQMVGAAHGAICEQVILAAEDSDTVTVTLPGGATETYGILRAEDGETSGGSGNDILCGLGGADTLTDVFGAAGFEVSLLEWCDDDGAFHATGWNERDGFIYRSARFDHRNQAGSLGFVSLIVDAMKAPTFNES
jgi:Ca2+-binding RTX toxin-like protein